MIVIYIQIFVFLELDSIYIKPKFCGINLFSLKIFLFDVRQRLEFGTLEQLLLCRLSLPCTDKERHYCWKILNLYKEQHKSDHYIGDRQKRNRKNNISKANISPAIDKQILGIHDRKAYSLSFKWFIVICFLTIVSQIVFLWYYLIYIYIFFLLFFFF